MKGLLLKDLYMAAKYCRSILLVIVVFLSISFLGEDNLIFGFYPCLFCGMIPASLLSYDERSKWNVYCGTLPYTRAQFVSVKYLFGLCAGAVVFILSAGRRKGADCLLHRLGCRLWNGGSSGESARGGNEDAIFVRKSAAHSLSRRNRPVRYILVSLHCVVSET